MTNNAQRHSPWWQSTPGAMIALGLAVMAVVVPFVLAASSPDAEPPSPAASQLPPGLAGRPAPRVRLPDARGGVIDTASLRGRPYVVTFLYVNCPDVCPSISQDLRIALEKLGSRARQTAVIAVSVDPKGDTRDAVRRFLDRQRLPKNFLYAVGSEQQLAGTWKAYFAAPQLAGRPDSAHTAALWLVDAKGRWRSHISAGMSVDANAVARRLSALLAERD